VPCSIYLLDTIASLVNEASSALPKDSHRDDKRIINKIQRNKVVETRLHDVKNR
jgi:hypothetical protein